MLEKLKTCWETFHPRSFTVSLRKQFPEVYEWVTLQSSIIPTKTFTDKVFLLLNPIQPVCANTKCENIVTQITRNGWSLYCSMQCKGQHNSLKSRVKSAATCLQTLGVDNPAKSADIRTKMKASTKVKLGVEYALQCNESQAKKTQTMTELYGVEHAAQSSVIQTKMVNTYIKNYAVTNPSKRHISVDTYEKLDDPTWLADQNKTNTINDIAIILGVSYPTVANAFKKYSLQPVKHNIIVSNAESEIVNFIKANSNTTIVESDRTILNPLELDIYLPQLNVAIEFDGNYWHSDLNGKDRNYHLNKTTQCMNKGIHLIHIWEYIYNQKTEIVLSKINNLLGNSKSVFGRKCVIKEIDTDTARNFLNRTHIQGYCSSTYRFGLYNNDVLVATMTFGKARFDTKYEYELLRYSTELGYSVAGGFSKLLSYFIKAHVPISIVSYSDLTWSIGNVYQKNGFVLSHRAKPSYFYTKDYVNFEHRMAYQKKKMPTKLQNFDSTLSEWENMQNNGYDRIWNCGNDVWVWKRQSI